jgi:hypothetical protein
MAYDVPPKVRRNARRGLELRAKQTGKKSGLTTREAGALGIGSGVARARDLIRGRVSLDTVRRMAAYFARHAKNYKLDPGKRPEDDRGYVAGLLWGGEAGRQWAEQIIRHEARENMHNNRHKAARNAARIDYRKEDGHDMARRNQPSELNADEREMFRQIMMIAENDGRSFEHVRKRGGSMQSLRNAIVSAAHEYWRYESQRFDAFLDDYKDAMAAELRESYGIENPGHYRAQRNYPKSQHRELAGLYDTSHKWSRGELQALHKKGYGQRDDEGLAYDEYESADHRVAYQGGMATAHEEAGGIVESYDFSDAKRHAKETLDDSEARYQWASFAKEVWQNNPPKKYDRWTRGEARNVSRKPVTIYVLYPKNSNAWGQLVPYKPRALPAAAYAGAVYEYAKGQKVPKGTKWIFFARDGSGIAPSAHKTLEAAKKAGLRAFGIESKARKNPAHGYGNLLPLASPRKKWNGAQARKRIKRLAKGKNGELRESVLRKAFLYVPAPEDRQKITAYKLPIADVVNGKLVAVPRAVSAADGALDGARGGVAISNHAKNKAKAIAKKYMAKIERANGKK